MHATPEPAARPRSWRDHLAPGTATVVGELTAEGSLPAAWARRWATAAGDPALFQVGRGGPDEGRWVSFGELDERTRRAATSLAGLGLRAGDRVLWSSGSTVAGIVWNLGALRAGLVVVPVNPAMTGRELSHVTSDVRPAAAMVADTASWRDVFADAGVTRVLDSSLDPSGAAGAAGGAGASAVDRSASSAPGLIGYTSGTTGAPKGAVLSHANLLANSTALVWAWRWTPADRLVHALPVFHGHGLCAGLYSTLLVGASAVLLPGFDANGVLDAAAEHRGTLFFGVPTMYHRLAGSGRAAELGSLRLAVSGSAPLAAELHGRLRVDGVDVLERYGMTETLLTVSNPVEGARRAGYVGFPLPGVEARLAGDTGEVQVRGPQVFEGYFERPAANADAFLDGWFRTGDLAEVDDGYVRILGRSGDVVISGGFNVYP
ncbi:MAG TPA: AMP-binding protein, partial [Acidimicrobiales bacterium]|nr:AMP-binding protein [Acidimicrobiales bacterium]